MKTWIHRWGPAILMMLVIFVASSVPGHDLPDFKQFDFDIKKAGHMMGYALLSMAYLRGLANRGPLSRRLLVIAVLFAGVYAITDEFHQTFTPGRNASLLDVLIDTAGAAIGAWIRSRIKASESVRGW